jgi:hypothetical protein
MPLGSGGMVTKARPWLIAAAATATMLVIIIAVDNPSVTRSIFEHNADAHGFGSRVLQSFTAYNWDVTKLTNDTGHFYLASLLTDIATLVLLFLLVAAVTIGRGSFLQVFVGTWVCVIVATMLAAYIRPAVLSSNYLGTTGTGKAETVFFSSFSPGPLPLFVSIVFGFVVALVAAFVGMLTRRDVAVVEPTAPATTVGPDATSEPVRREPWTAPPATRTQAAPPAGERPPWADRPNADEEHTTAMPAVDEPGTSGDQHTRQLPPVEDDPR